MAVNKVVYGNKTLIDLTDDTVTADTLAEGITAHDKTGAQITGTMSISGGGIYFETDETLTLKNGVLSVNTSDEPEKDNTLPITSSAVFTTVGNINALLETI